MALSDARIRGLKPRGKPYKVADARGLYMLVQSSGTKCWRFDYSFNRKRRTVSFGQHPDIGLGKARDHLLEARRLLSEGADPSTHKRARARAAKLASANTFKAVAEELLTAAEKQKLAKKTLTKKKWILRDLIYRSEGAKFLSRFCDGARS